MAGERKDDWDRETAAATAPAGITAAKLDELEEYAGDADEAVEEARTNTNEGTGTEFRRSSAAATGAADPPAHVRPLDEDDATTAPAGIWADRLDSPEAVAGDPDEAVEGAGERR